MLRDVHGKQGRCNTDMRASVIRKYVVWTLGVAALLVNEVLGEETDES